MFSPFVASACRQGPRLVRVIFEIFRICRNAW